MTDDKIIDISDAVVGLKVRLENLVIETHDGECALVPLPEVAALVLANPHVTVTNAVLAGVAGSGGVVVVADAKHQPAGMLLPLDAHFAQGERFRIQAAAPLPLKKRLWQQIICSKVKAQAGVLARLSGSDQGLSALVAHVASGDAGNIEARAAQRYWTFVFDDPNFHRDRNGGGANRLLNYGYAVLRALTARAICAAGLHPALGVNHHNRYDPFCLASDLMEPFRPRVDEAVVHLVAAYGSNVEVGREIKRELISGILGPLDVDGERRTMFSVLARAATSMAAIYAGERKKLQLPEW